MTSFIQTKAKKKDLKKYFHFLNLSSFKLSYPISHTSNPFYENSLDIFDILFENALILQKLGLKCRYESMELHLSHLGPRPVVP